MSFLSHSSHLVFTSVENPSSACLSHGDAAEGLSASPCPIQPTPTVLICMSSSSQNQSSPSLPPLPILLLPACPCLSHPIAFPGYRSSPDVPLLQEASPPQPPRPTGDHLYPHEASAVTSLVCCIVSLLPVDKHLRRRLDPLLSAWARANATSSAAPPNHLTLDNSMPPTCPSLCFFICFSSWHHHHLALCYVCITPGRQGFVLFPCVCLECLE